MRVLSQRRCGVFYEEKKCLAIHRMLSFSWPKFRSNLEFKQIDFKFLLDDCDRLPG